MIPIHICEKCLNFMKVINHNSLPQLICNFCEEEKIKKKWEESD